MIVMPVERLRFPNVATQLHSEKKRRVFVSFVNFCNMYRPNNPIARDTVAKILEGILRERAMGVTLVRRPCEQGLPMDSILYKLACYGYSPHVPYHRNLIGSDRAGWIDENMARPTLYSPRSSLLSRQIFIFFQWR